MSAELIARASVLNDVGRPAEAVQLLAAHLASDPEDAAAWRLISEAQRRLGDGAASLYSAQQAVRLNPDDDQGHGLVALALLAQGAGAAALAPLNEALRLHPHSRQHLHNRALANHESGRDREALVDIDAAIELSPLEPSSHLLRGVVLSSLKRRKESAAANRRALELNPGMALAHNNAAADALRAGRIGKAADALNRAIAADPQHGVIQGNIEAVVVRLARRMYLGGVGASLLGALAVELEWPAVVRHIVLPVLVLVVFAVGLSPLRRLSSGARRFLVLRVRGDAFLIYACAVAVFSFLFALVALTLPLRDTQGQGGWLRLFLFLNIGYVVWARRWAKARKLALRQPPGWRRGEIPRSH
jgi:tetratricopeptide (TPR) repeat protein